jgi:hypothetical protein
MHRLPYILVFLGLVVLTSLSLHTSPTEATSNQCGAISVPWPLANGPDRDCDGFPDSLETPDFIHTHRYVGCSATSDSDDEASNGILNAWPVDFNDDQRVNVTDKTRMSLAIYNYNNYGTFNQRYDLNADHVINVLDRAKVVQFMVATGSGAIPCTAIAPAPPAATTSRYMSTVDPGHLYDEGCVQALAYQSGVVILDFGQPDYNNNQYGTRLKNFAATQVSVTDIRTAAEYFASGFYNCTPQSVPEPTPLFRTPRL